MNHDERNQFLFDVFVTALEGGINYWAGVSEYHIWLPDTDYEPDLLGFYATIHPIEEKEILRVDRAVVNRGLRRIYRARPAPYDGYLRHPSTIKYLSMASVELVREALRTRDAGEIDASEADNIVQVGLFGGLVYG